MSRLLIVSNRLPISISKKQNKLRFQKSTGGLATGLASLSKTNRKLWIGWPGISSEKMSEIEKKEIIKKLNAEKCYPVFLSKRDIDDYYQGFCNNIIWPLFSYFPQYAKYRKRYWEAYERVNEIFCQATLNITKKEDVIWINDYHLMLLPKLIRKKIPDAKIGFFLHIPFPSSELFRLLPWRNEIAEGLLGSDLIGFHTYDYVRHFLNSIRFLLGHECSLNQIFVNNRIVKADAFPMGINFEKFSESSKDSKIKNEIKYIRKKVGERKIILSIDRLDYTKGISQRLESFDYFLEKYPKYKEKVTMILVVSPSRAGVQHYQVMKKHIDELIGAINGKHGTMGWVPIWYLYRYISFQNLIALYDIADIALVTPLRDGMNLISKEYVATKAKGKGVLILSEMAGSAKELGEAIIVNPNHKEAIAEAIKEALEMPEEEQIERNRAMQMRLKRYDISRWLNDFLNSLSTIKKIQDSFSAKRLTIKIKRKLIHSYKKSENRLIFLDYDGTLIPFAKTPEKVKPDSELLKLLNELDEDSKNEVIIISGRKREILDKWFKDADLELIAEHGVWIKEKDRDWELLEPLRSEWKEEIRPLLELHMDRTPGSFIEEKDHSLVWHYRKSDPILASLRARELNESLLQLTSNLNLAVLEGSKVIEIKNAGVDKGKAALRFISKKKRDFILAIGDDWTDEDVFSILPKSAHSIKVRISPSQAKYNVESPSEVRQLLKELVK